MPRIRLNTIVSTSARKIESRPIPISDVPMIVPSPVSVMVPTTMPTSAQARPTGSACRAPSASAARQPARISRPRTVGNDSATRAATTSSAIATLVQIDQAQMSARPTQKTILITGVAKAEPRPPRQGSARP